jgi:Transcriptional regulatory protein, C terminal
VFVGLGLGLVVGSWVSWWAVPGVSDGAPTVWVQLLGPVRAWRGGRQLSLGPRQQQLVLAVLALRAGTAVSREELVDAVWDRAPGSAVNGVHKYVHGLRSALEPGGRGNPARMLVSVDGGYELRLAPGQLDAAVFAGHRQAARRSRRCGDAGAAGAVAPAGLPAPATRPGERARPGPAARPRGTGPPPLTAPRNGGQGAGQSAAGSRPGRGRWGLEGAGPRCRVRPRRRFGIQCKCGAFGGCRASEVGVRGGSS